MPPQHSGSQDRTSQHQPTPYRPQRPGWAGSAVVPAAGFATRFLPATKTVPKELLPVVDRPVLQYIVEEAVGAGITDVLMITGRGKTSMVDYFDRRPDLEAALAAKGDERRLAAIRGPAELAEIYTVRQPEMLGLGHAVGCAERHVGNAPFAVLLPDEFFDDTGEIDTGEVPSDQPGGADRTALLPRMLDLQARTGGIVLALMEVPDDQVGRYGIASVAPYRDDAGPDGAGRDDAGRDDAGRDKAGPDRAGPDDTVQVTGLVEKPRLEQAPSNLAVIGRYVLPGGIFEAIRRTKPGSGGEIQLTDAMALMLAEGTPVHGVIHRGVRFDTGVPLGYLQAVVQLACQREDIGPELRQWLADLVHSNGWSAGT